jgi:hypothetical protein
MNTTLIMNRWQRWLQATLTDLHLYQIHSLALFSLAAARARHCHLSRLCAHAPSAAQPLSIRRRLLRLLGNEHLDVTAACRQMACWLQRWNAPSCRLLLLLDETPWHNQWRVLKVSVAWRRRALPLCWTVFPLRHRQAQPMPASVEALLQQAQQLVTHYAPQAQVVLLADRGFCWPPVVRWCQAQGWSYVLRAQHHTKLRYEDESEDETGQLKAFKECALRELAPAPNHWWCGSGQVFKKAGWLTCNVVAAWPQGAPAAWLLVTNLPPTLHCCRWYARRVWQEESFRDEKSHGFCWQESQVGVRQQDTERVNRLLLLLALAQLWLMSLGAAARSATWRQCLGLCGRVARRRWSVFGWGWQFLQWLLHQPPHRLRRFPCQLCFAPP